jgi:hypothetical protein
MNMNNMPVKQKGMTFTGWLTILLMLGFFVFLGLKLVPVYLENLTVKDIVNAMKEEPLITQRSANDVTKMIMHRLDLNGVYDLKRNHVKVKKSPGVMQISIDYTVQKKMVGNIDVLITFSDYIELVSN